MDYRFLLTGFSGLSILGLLRRKKMAREKFERNGQEYTLLTGEDAEKAIGRTYPYYVEDGALGARKPAECAVCDRITCGRWHLSETQIEPLCTKCWIEGKAPKTGRILNEDGTCPDCGGNCDLILNWLQNELATS
jgi:hypothetical protein